MQPRTVKLSFREKNKEMTWIEMEPPIKLFKTYLNTYFKYKSETLKDNFTICFNANL